MLRIFCNDLDAPAQEIADLYRRRWAIELFFRWVKQVLKITRFLGTSENAVRIQIAVALIAFLLLCGCAQAAQKAVQSPLAFARLVRANLLHRRRIDRLLANRAAACRPNLPNRQYNGTEISTGQPWVKPGHDELEFDEVYSAAVFFFASSSAKCFWMVCIIAALRFSENGTLLARSHSIDSLRHAFVLLNFGRT